MQHLMTVVEQLDRAASELATDHPINNRLALILVDNAVELILHRQCTDLLEHDTTMSKIHKAMLAIGKDNPRGDLQADTTIGDYVLLTPKQRAWARGYSMPNKAKTLAQREELTEPERRFIDAAHSYRNQLYHVGLDYDDIIRSVAGQYYALCCDLFARLKPAWRTISSTDTYTEVASRYLPQCNGKVTPWSVDSDTLAEKLRGALPDTIPDLAQTLGESAVQSVDAIEESFDFLVQDNPSNLGKEELLEIAQWNLDLEKKLLSDEVNGLWVDPDYRTEWAEVSTALEVDWKQRHHSLPTARWRNRAYAIRKETDPLIAMDKYQSLRNDMAYLEEAVQSAASELDHWIQTQIDLARGK